MGYYLKGLVRLFLLEYPLSEVKKNSLLWGCLIRRKRPDYLKVPLFSPYDPPYLNLTEVTTTHTQGDTSCQN